MSSSSYLSLSSSEVMSVLLPAAKRGVVAAARLAATVQAEVLAAASSAATKVDASPVTIGDFGAQCVFSKLVQESPALADKGLKFRLLAEEEAATLAAAESGLQEAVVTAVNRSLSSTEGAAAAAALDLKQILSLLDAGQVDDSNVGEQSNGFFILDPIDGTKGFLRRGQWAVGCAFFQQGRPVLSIIACPNLPWRSEEETTVLADGPAVDASKGQVGSLFFAVEGQGAFIEPLPSFFSSSNSASVPVPISGPRRIQVRDGTPIDRLVYSESFERGHSDSSTTSKLARAAGIDAATPVVRCDSMVKYCCVASGQVDAFMRFMPGSYQEKLWDHAPGMLLVREAGGIVTDALGTNPIVGEGAVTGPNPRLIPHHTGIIAAGKKTHAELVEAAKKVLA